MRTSSQLLLTFLLNAVWQIALLAALASCGAWLLRQSGTRYQHWLWVAALCLSLLVLAATAVWSLPATAFSASALNGAAELNSGSPVSVRSIRTFERTSAITSNSPFQLNSSLAVLLLSVYAVFVFIRGFRLWQAWF